MTTNLGPLLGHILMSLSTLVDRQSHDLKPSNEDFYLLGGGLTEIISQLRMLTTTLQRQVRRYDTQTLCCDTGGDPRVRLRCADDQLETISEALSRAGIAARAYQFTAGHLLIDPPMASIVEEHALIPRQQRYSNGLNWPEPKPPFKEPTC